MISDHEASDSKRQSLKNLRSLGETGAWLGTGLLWAVMPKCPMCLAAYVAIGTGIGLSFSTARYLQAGLMALCVGSLLFLTRRLVRRSLSLVVGGQQPAVQAHCCGTSAALED